MIFDDVGIICVYIISVVPINVIGLLFIAIAATRESLDVNTGYGFLGSTVEYVSLKSFALNLCAAQVQTCRYDIIIMLKRRDGSVNDSAETVDPVFIALSGNKEK